jgi:hypothetical protein
LTRAALRWCRYHANAAWLRREDLFVRDGRNSTQEIGEVPRVGSKVLLGGDRMEGQDRGTVFDEVREQVCLLLAGAVAGLNHDHADAGDDRGRGRT